MYLALANAVLGLHVLIVLFVVVGLLLILVGNALAWRWVNFIWFRLLHLFTIAVVVAESWLGIVCPLTTLESWLRMRGGQRQHDLGFIEYWLQQLLFFEGPPWVFTLAYSLFAALVVLSWWYFPPGRKRG